MITHASIVFDGWAPIARTLAAGVAGGAGRVDEGDAVVPATDGRTRTR